jgi:hypothetical protein
MSGSPSRPWDKFGTEINFFCAISFPRLDLHLHRLEIPLDAVDRDLAHVDETEVLRVLRQHRNERA